MRSAIIVALVLCGATVRAQPQPDDSIQRAEQAMQRGIAATARGEHEAALSAYREASKLVPDANLPHKLAGEALEALGRFPDAAAEYRRYIEIKPDAKGVVEVRARLDKLEREHIATLEVRCDLVGAFVELDGKPIGKTPLAPITLVAPTKVTIALTALGHTKREEQIDVPAGVLTPYECKLEPVRSATPPPAGTAIDHRVPPPEPHEPKWYRRWQIIVPVALVAAAAIS